MPTQLSLPIIYVFVHLSTLYHQVRPFTYCSQVPRSNQTPRGSGNMAGVTIAVLIILIGSFAFVIIVSFYEEASSKKGIYKLLFYTVPRPLVLY